MEEEPVFNQEKNGFVVESGVTKVQERLQRRHQERIEDAERKKETKESRAVAEEKLEYFSSTFNGERRSVEELLFACSGADRAAVTQKLEEATAKTMQLQKFLNDSVVFLTQYELRQAQAALQKLQTSLTETKEKALPRKKFAFKARSKVADFTQTSPVPPPPPEGDTPAESSQSCVVDGAAPSRCGFSGMSNESLTMTSQVIQKQDVLLTHLTNCRVRLFGSPSTLHLKHIQGCEILCGPVSSSVFIDHCSSSVLALACQQLRTHNTTDTLVYLHVTSRAIIEDCQGVGFAPFSWSYPTLEEDFVVSGLDRDQNNWNQVDDFNWLAAGTPSPNWTVIPEADRKNNWDT
ncbi:tubulin-specific chaperone C [Pholidichthys leucotaenia]